MFVVGVVRGNGVVGVGGHMTDLGYGGIIYGDIIYTTIYKE